MVAENGAPEFSPALGLYANYLVQDGVFDER